MDPATLEALILKELCRRRDVSRRDLAERLGVARSTAGRRVDSLIERGLLLETGLEERREAGRPKRLLQLRGDFGKFVGFDFDARFLHAVLVDFDRKPLEAESVALPAAPDRKDVLGRLKEWIDRFGKAGALHGGGAVLGYGFGVPGQVRSEERLALGYPYIGGWERLSLPGELGLPPDRVRIENNTRAIALGEYWLGGKSIENLLCLNARTGISVAIVAEGRLLRGHLERAGEIGAWRVESSADRASPAFLERRATVPAALDPGGGVAPSDGESWGRFVGSCLGGDREALPVLDEIARHHGDVLARLVQAVDPEQIAVAGEFCDLGEIYLSALREHTAAALAGSIFPPPPIRSVAHGRLAGAYGAAALAAEHYRPGD